MHYDLNRIRSYVSRQIINLERMILNRSDLSNKESCNEIYAEYEIMQQISRFMDHHAGPVSSTNDFEAWYKQHFCPPQLLQSVADIAMEVHRLRTELHLAETTYQRAAMEISSKQAAQAAWQAAQRNNLK